MKLLKTTLDGLEFWYRQDDKFVGERIALGKYEEYETKLILSQVSSKSVVVDVGANIGYYTILLASRCKKVYAIEPDISCFEILKKNVELNKIKNVVLLNVAASNKKESRKLFVDKKNLGNSRLNPSKSPFDKGDLRFVNCLRLDNILRNEQIISLIKIDTQGWEPAVIDGAKKTIEKHHPTLFLEYTPTEYKDNKMIEYLKLIYKNIRSIDFWFYIARDGIRVNHNTGYVDLWMSDKKSLFDVFMQYKNVQIKKVLKAIMNYGKN